MTGSSPTAVVSRSQSTTNLESGLPRKEKDDYLSAPPEVRKRIEHILEICRAYETHRNYIYDSRREWSSEDLKHCNSLMAKMDDELRRIPSRYNRIVLNKIAGAIANGNLEEAQELLMRHMKDYFPLMKEMITAAQKKRDFNRERELVYLLRDSINDSPNPQTFEKSAEDLFCASNNCNTALDYIEILDEVGVGHDRIVNLVHKKFRSIWNSKEPKMDKYPYMDRLLWGLDREEITIPQDHPFRGFLKEVKKKIDNEEAKMPEGRGRELLSKGVPEQKVCLIVRTRILKKSIDEVVGKQPSSKTR